MEIDRRVVSLCLLTQAEVEPFLEELRQEFSSTDLAAEVLWGALSIELTGEKGCVEQIIDRIRRRFSTFVFDSPAGQIAEAVHRELTVRKKTLALAESCTGGALAARLTAIPGASQFFLGSLVVYSNRWKERFLQVSRTTLKQSGAVSLKTVQEMAQGLFHETDADYVIAVSGIAGPDGGSADKPVGTVCFAVAERNCEIDLGKLQGPSDRASSIEWTVQTALGALWRLIVHKKQTFS